VAERLAEEEQASGSDNTSELEFMSGDGGSSLTDLEAKFSLQGTSATKSSGKKKVVSSSEILSLGFAIAIT
jgi:hypothetical protein